MRIGFALEYSLGHTTHARNLKRVLDSGAISDVEAVYVDVPYDDTPVGAWSSLPPVRSNWTVRASLATYLALRPRARTLDALLFHTQVTSLFSTGLMRRIPTVISLDATPILIDSLGAAYDHAPSSSGLIESWKKRLNIRAFQSARRLVAWSEWTKTSLVDDYGIAADKVSVIPPGVDLDIWSFPPRVEKPNDATIHLLFVGGDWIRKGGETLLAAYDALPAALRARTRLHLVTRSAPPEIAETRPGVQIYANLTANSDALRALYAQADLFVFPTRADCLGIAVLEALASGLPAITTAVGGLPEVVTDGKDGVIVPVDDAAALTKAIERLIVNGKERTTMGWCARETACARFDAARNYVLLVQTVIDTARESVSAK